MLGTVKDIEFDNITEGVPAFVTIACMALTYSIGDGLTLGILTYVFVNIFYNIFGAKRQKTKTCFCSNDCSGNIIYNKTLATIIGII